MAQLFALLKHTCYKIVFFAYSCSLTKGQKVLAVGKHCNGEVV